MTKEEFRAGLQHAGNTRGHKVTHSVGVYDAYKYIRRNKWLNIGRPLTEKEFYSIVRRMGNYLAEALCMGHEIKMPAQMGTLELRKNDSSPYFKGARLVNHLPIDWDATLKLWYEDKESFDNKTLVKCNEREIFKVFYNRATADFNNKSFYEFQVNRDIKRTLTKRIKNGRIDAFLNNTYR